MNTKTAEELIAERTMALRITMGEKYGPAMVITDQALANDYFELIVEHCMRCHVAEEKPIEEAEARNIERSNLGYYAGYYDRETRERVENLFDCAHPFFGKVAVQGQPTPEMAFNMGKALGAAAKQ